MTLHELHFRACSHAVRSRITLKSLIDDHGVRHSTLRRALRGVTEMRRETALRLLPLVARLALAGEPVCLVINGRMYLAARDAAAHTQN
jgi:hypothetical protein